MWPTNIATTLLPIKPLITMAAFSERCKKKKKRTKGINYKLVVPTSSIICILLVKLVISPVCTLSWTFARSNHAPIMAISASPSSASVFGFQEPFVKQRSRKWGRFAAASRAWRMCRRDPHLGGHVDHAGSIRLGWTPGRSSGGDGG